MILYEISPQPRFIITGIAKNERIGYLKRRMRSKKKAINVREDIKFSKKV